MGMGMGYGGGLVGEVSCKRQPGALVYKAVQVPFLKAPCLWTL